MELEKTGAELTPEETERLAEHRQKKAAQHKAWHDAIHITSNADGGEIFSFLLSFIPVSNEPSGCLQTFGDCREGQIPRCSAALQV